jgi:hypothetical protein
MEYIFTQIEDDGSKVEHRFSAIGLDEMLRRFRWFLAGCSFVLDSSDQVILKKDPIDTK